MKVYPKKLMITKGVKCDHQGYPKMFMKTNRLSPASQYVIENKYDRSLSEGE
jgi:hypothetical protein